jgi:hypothetical protein
MALIAMSCGGSSKVANGRALASSPADVLEYHKNPSKDGLYVDPLITRDAAATAHRDTSFNASLPGQVYAQPLYVQNGPGGTPVILVGTEENAVVAIAAADGSQVWRRDLDSPANRTQLPCGNIMPHEGITGTPVIDLTARTIYVAANTNDAGTVRQKIYALSLDDGSTVDGWPVDVSASVSFGSLPFSSLPQGQRGALLLRNGYLYVPYGGHFGDCGSYHGWVVAVPTNDPSSPSAYATEALRGGIWAPAGLSSDGSAVFTATGNTVNATTWMGGEAVFRLGDGASFSGETADHFYPSNWRALDTGDADVGGVAPIVVDVVGANPSALLVAIGKNGVAYLVDRSNLGGQGTGDGIRGEGVYSDRIVNPIVINAPAAFTASSGTYVAMASSGNGIGCPGSAGNLVVFQITATMPPTISIAWCAIVGGRYAPIVTTTDGTSDSVLWTISSGFPSNKLRAYNAETGEVLFDGGGTPDAIGTLKGFLAPIAVNGRIFIAGDNQLYAFTTQ